ncbi:hypothetical protein WN48_08028 [Eufriesea mexicana]|uniref:Uncharacterized protein n=1 Tax=Eufriesea mexicana TaxID=516756 RepID=A0A310STE5_9HYME|nr:hypothetical protein WN48_08028 [Eufriesea mexicana]
MHTGLCFVVQLAHCSRRGCPRPTRPQLDQLQRVSRGVTYFARKRNGSRHGTRVREPRRNGEREPNR